MRRTERLVEIRQRQRDQALESLTTAQRRMGRMIDARTELLTEQRQQLDGGQGELGVSLARLDQMDAAHQQLEAALRREAARVEQARKLALEMQLRLKQVELLRDKTLEREAQDERRQDRKLMDALAQRQHGQRSSGDSSFQRMTASKNDGTDGNQQ